MERGRLHGLDALRGIAALSVLAYHLLANTVGAGATNAYLAVDFFFLLSGYLMTRTYEERMAGGMGAWSFLTLRYARLWPVMACSMIIGLPFVFSVYGLSWQTGAAVALNFALVPSFLGGHAFAINFPAWSIFLELTANLFHGLVIWRVRSRLLLFAVGALIAIFIAHGLDKHPLMAGMNSDNFLASFRRVLLTYLLGVWMYRAMGETPAIAMPSWLTLAIMPAMFIGTWLVGTNPGVLDLAFAVVACPILLIGGLQLKPGAILRWLGRISFPLYAVHTPIMALLILYHLPVLLALPLAFAGAMLIDFLTGKHTPRISSAGRDGDDSPCLRA